MKAILPWIRDFFRKADMVLLVLCLVCTIFGLVLISSATKNMEGGSFSFLFVQSFALLLGLGFFVVFSLIDIDVFADKWGLLLGLEIGLMLLLIPFGIGADETGNRGWIRFFGIGIQPSEIVRVIYIVLMAKHISHLKGYRRLDSVFSVGQLVVHFGFIFALIIFISSDLGSALVFAFIFAIMLFVAGLKLRWFAIGIASVAAVVPFVWNNFLREDQKNRILAPYIPDVVDPTGFGITWQVRNSKLALASGQFTGTGLYNGTQSQSASIPGKHTDFIFAVCGEELGMLGCLVIIALLLAIVIRCVYIGIKSNNTMNMLVCFGVAAGIFFQTFENIGMCTGILPVVGLTLPFFSYGGSSIFSTFAAVGLVSGIKYRPKPERFHSL